MTSDEGEYAYQARLLSEGGVPYRDAYCQKPPMVFFLYRLAYAAPGAKARPGSPLPARLLAALFSCAAMALLFLLTPSGWGAASRLCAPAAFAALSVEPIGDLFSANTEAFLCVFLSFAALALLRALGEERERPAMLWLLACGVSCGAALATKQTAAWTVLAFGALAAWKTRDRRRLWLFAAGVALLPAIFAAYFAARGGLPDLLEQAWTRNLDYASLLLQPEAAGQQLAWLSRTLLPLFLRGDWPFYSLALIALAGGKTEDAERLGLLAALWLASSWIGICTGLFFFPHYFLQAAPPLALCAALGIQRLHMKNARLGAAAALFACLWPALAWGRAFFVDSPEATAGRILFPNPLYESAAVGGYMREHSSPQDRAYVFGSEPQLYLHAGLRAATRHIYVFPLTLFPRGMADIERELSALRGRPPRYLVFVDIPASTLVASAPGERFREGILDLLQRRYRLLRVAPVVAGSPARLVPTDRGITRGSAASEDLGAAERAGPAELGRESLLLFELIHSPG